MIKITNEVIDERIKDKNFIRISNYVNADTKIEWRCKKCNYIWSATTRGILCGSGCPSCKGGVRYTHQQYVEKVAKIHGDEYDVIGTYINSKTKIKMRHNICKCEFESLASCLLKGKGHGCSKCNGTTKDNEYFLNKLKSIHKNKIICLEKYKNNNTKLKFKCTLCDTTYRNTPANVYYAEHGGCPTCSPKISSPEKFLVLSKLKWNNSIIPIDEYKGSHHKINFKCMKCQLVFSSTPTNHLSNKGCPHCRCSIMEEKISNFLNSKKIDFEKQKRFETCRNKKPLPFDFYIEKYNLLIEYDGEQHYKPWYKIPDAKEHLKYIQNNDNIKTKWCEENNVRLIRIPYTKKRKFKSIILNMISTLLRENKNVQ